MHAITKFLVVVASVLCIFLSALVVAYAANTDRIRSDYATERAARLAAEGSVASQTGQWEAEQNRLNRKIDELRGTLTQRESEINAVRLEAQNLRTEKATAERDRDSYKIKIDDFAAQIKTMQTLLSTYSDDVRGLRTSDLASRQQRAELEQTVADLQSRVDVLTQNRRALEEQLAEARLALATGAKGPGAVGAGMLGAESGQPYLASQLITGKVDEVTREQGTGNIVVKISVGSNSGVAKNMKFFIGRGNRWLANVVVIEADLRTSIGVLQNLGTPNEVQAGDFVTSVLQQ